MAAITIENLSKEYVIGGGESGRNNIREMLADSLLSPFRRFRRLRGNAPPHERFWALKDISFDVAKGVSVGIIGRNGAGKSTLLKILSQVTRPTAGRVELEGRIGSLLEVGTGFHPELTGRENIFLNGVILGMSRAQIRARFDEIVAFSEIEQFLDTPVKRYSSGMYVRLAFSVAAHLEPEILVIDEVLAVGDARFQKKCVGKMEEVRKKGHTILFVSHNMQAIRSICDRAIWLDSGRVAFDGDPSNTIGRYLLESNPWAGEDIEEVIRNLPPDPAFRLESVSLAQEGSPIRQIAENTKPLEIEVRYRVLKQTTGLRIFFDLCDDQDVLVLQSFHDERSEEIPTMDPGFYVSRAVVPANLLGPVSYEIRIRAGIHNLRSCLPPPGVRLSVKVEDTRSSKQAYVNNPFRGKLAVPIEWTTRGERLPFH